jgi:excisionase family DNA binding protein
MVNATKQVNSFVRVREIAASLNVTESHLYALIKRGKVEAVRIGHSVRVPAKEAERLLREGTGK